MLEDPKDTSPPLFSSGASVEAWATAGSDAFEVPVGTNVAARRCRVFTDTLGSEASIAQIKVESLQWQDLPLLDQNMEKDEFLVVFFGQTESILFIQFQSQDGEIQFGSLQGNNKEIKVFSYLDNNQNFVTGVFDSTKSKIISFAELSKDEPLPSIRILEHILRTIKANQKSGEINHPSESPPSSGEFPSSQSERPFSPRETDPSVVSGLIDHQSEIPPRSTMIIPSPFHHSPPREPHLALPAISQAPSNNEEIKLILTFTRENPKKAINSSEFWRDIISVPNNFWVYLRNPDGQSYWRIFSKNIGSKRAAGFADDGGNIELNFEHVISYAPVIE